MILSSLVLPACAGIRCGKRTSVSGKTPARAAVMVTP